MTVETAGTSQSAARLWLLFAAVILVLIGISAYFWFTAQQTNQLTEDPTVPIGGPFEMVDHTGQAVTAEDFKGKPSLYFFGFTFCPDICPTHLADASDVLDSIGASADDMNFVFVTVDPERDTPEIMSGYVGAFHPDLIGLTGSIEQVAHMTKTFRIFHRRVELPGTDGDYTMDHSAFSYLMGPNGHYITHFGGDYGPEKMANILKSVM